MTGELAGLAERATADVEKLLVNARRGCTAPIIARPNARLRASRIPRLDGDGGGCAARSTT